MPFKTLTYAHRRPWASGPTRQPAGKSCRPLDAPGKGGRRIFAALIGGLSIWLVAGLALSGCDRSEPPATSTQAQEPKTTTLAKTPWAREKFAQQREKIRRATATLANIKVALADPDPMGLTNSILLLYLMREDPVVAQLLSAMWRMEKTQHPNLPWDRLRSPAARVALAHTLARTDTSLAAGYVDFIRVHMDHTDPFVRAQAAVALGFVGTEADIPSLQRLAAGDSPYDSQSAIKALAIRGSEQARIALVELRGASAGNGAKRRVIETVLAEHFPNAGDQHTKP